MAGIGDLVANLSVNTGNWNAAFSGAGSVVGKFGEAAAKAVAASGVAFGSAAKGVGHFAQSTLAGLGRVVAGYGQYRVAMAKAATETTRSRLMIEKQAAQLTRVKVGGMGGFGLAVGGITAAWHGVAGVISNTAGGYKTALDNQRKFQSVLEATGGSAGVTTAEMSDYAAELQRVTNFEDDATMGAAAFMASLSNVRGDNFKRSIALAQDMATVMGTDLDSAVKKMGKSFKDLSPDEVTAKLDEMQSRFGGAAQAVADPWKQFQNTLGDVGESIGSTMLPSINMLAESLTSMLGIVAGGGAWFKAIGIEAAVVFSHMGGLLVLGVTQWELFGVQVLASAAHLFTDAMPVYVKWFADNWGKILFTAVDYTLTLFINLGQNIRNLWQTTLDFFAGKGVNFNWVPLTEGFKSAIDKLPDVPERIAGDFEKSLQRDIAAMSENLGKSMDTTRADLEKKFSPVAKIKKFVPPEEESSDKKTPTEPKAAKSESMKTETKAAFKGSQEAASIMLRGSGGSRLEQGVDKMVKAQQETVKAIKESKPCELQIADF